MGGFESRLRCLQSARGGARPTRAARPTKFKEERTGPQSGTFVILRLRIR